MKKIKLLILDIIIYILQIFIMISFSRYTHNNSLYTYFIFSLIFNSLLCLLVDKRKLYVFRILSLNIFFAISVYFFGNLNMLIAKTFILAVNNILFNTLILVLTAGNWMLPIICRKILIIQNKLE